MKPATPWPLLIFRAFAGIALLGLIVHLLKGSTVSILPYKVIGWLVVSLLALMLFLSWVRRPFSAYAIASFVPLLPAAFILGLWLIVLKSSPVWEVILVGGSYMLLPIALSVQIVRDRATRKYFNYTTKPQTMR
jgi:hypothetical protein